MVVGEKLGSFQHAVLRRQEPEGDQKQRKKAMARSAHGGKPSRRKGESQPRDFTAGAFGGGGPSMRKKSRDEGGQGRQRADIEEKFEGISARCWIAGRLGFGRKGGPCDRSLAGKAAVRKGVPGVLIGRATAAVEPRSDPAGFCSRAPDAPRHLQPAGARLCVCRPGLPPYRCSSYVMSILARKAFFFASPLKRTLWVSSS